MIIADAVILNQVLDKAEFKDLSYKSFAALIDLKLQLSNINEDKDKFILETYKTLKLSRIDTLDENSDNYTEECKKVQDDLNLVLLNYLIKDVDLNITQIDKEDFYKFCYKNEFNGKVIECLYKLMV